MKQTADTKEKSIRTRIEDSSLGSFLEAISHDEGETELTDLRKRMVLSLVFLAAQVAVWILDTRFSADLQWNPKVLLLVEAVLLIPLIALNHRCFVDGFRAIRRAQPEKNTLAALGSVLAVAILHFVTAGVVLTTIAVCRYWEAWIRCRLTVHLADLIDREPDDEGIKKGDILTVGPGEIFPADGVVLSGGSSVDEELITGARVPARKDDGDEVFAGTQNVTAEVSVRVINTGEDRVISRIILHISRAFLTKPPLAARAERTARRFVAAVIVIAALVTAMWMLAETPFPQAMLMGISILIIANPYAFSVAPPMGVLASTARGAEYGILISSARLLDKIRDINTIVINKTGTITSGQPEISDVIPYQEGFDLKLAGILETDAKHPFGKMIRREAKEQFGEIPEAEVTEIIEGRGFRCRYQGKDYLVGNSALMGENGISTEDEQTRKLFRQGKSLVFFAGDRGVEGIIALRDIPKPSSLKAITRLEEAGIDVVMITGDSRETAEAIRSEVGIDHIFAETLPEQKQSIVEKIRKEKKKIVAVVGDGVQDAPALDAADLGIAIGTGRDIYIGPADIVLVSDDLLDVNRAMRLSRMTLRNLRQSIAFAYIYNSLAIIAAAGLLVLITGITIAPVASALCMCASQILVALNALRIRRVRL
ncbi:MAG: heavy metal translocating P-type ATPase [Firmicutes bacterium]|nr:heavy metal translocating P-type ATPase [Bacillota bacterium]